MREGDPAPHLHLYHAPSSICAQKVRATFAATQQPYISHTLNLMAGDSYDAVYVRVRAEGCNNSGLKLVQDHTGGTSVATSGCDPCVVPTVVDDRTNEIIVDSRHICLELDRRNPSTPQALAPDSLLRAIEAELAIVDNMPNYQLLASTFGKPSDDAPANFFAKSKVTRCEKLLQKHSDEPLLMQAYEAKRRKEQMAVDALFDQASLEEARRRTVEVFRGLDQRLQIGAGPYRFGGSVTIADLFWGVELIRAEDLGLADIWGDSRLPSLASYYQTICEIPALRYAVLECEGARFKKP
jgi:2,5-dichlorohydroquinone reductive dechlorinase